MVKSAIIYCVYLASKLKFHILVCKGYTNNITLGMCAEGRPQVNDEDEISNGQMKANVRHLGHISFIHLFYSFISFTCILRLELMLEKPNKCSLYPPYSGG